MKQHAKQNHALYFFMFLPFLLLMGGCKKDLQSSGANSNGNGRANSPAHAASTNNSCTDFKFDYAGVRLAYVAATDVLQFRSIADVKTVIDRLNADYEDYNLFNESQHPDATDEEMDVIDQQNGFDEFFTIKRFESAIPCFTSKRSQIEQAENLWMINGLRGADPDDIDFTFNDAENVLFNSNYEIQIGDSIYTLRADGLYSPSGIMEVQAADCFAYKKNHDLVFDNDRAYRVKAIINSSPFMSSVTGKIMSYRKNATTGAWEKSRSMVNITTGGNLYDQNCNPISSNFSTRTPSATAFISRRQLQLNMNSISEYWKTRSGELTVSFQTKNNTTSTVTLY